MTTEAWSGDACGLVDAFRAGDLSPLEAFDSVAVAIEASSLNALSHLDLDAAREAAARADVSLPFGGVPMGIKELETVAAWPSTLASVPLSDQVAQQDSTQVARLRAAGAVLAAQTTAPEFGASLQTHSKLHGVTRNPWAVDRTPGGSSGGSAAAVAGGLLPIASASDGGGSTRVPAAFTGLVGLKATFGRIPKGPRTLIGAVHSTVGCLSRSVRDTARWLDVANGYDPRDPNSLPRIEGWERGLGTNPLQGRRAVIAPDLLGAAVVSPEVEATVRAAGELLAKAAGLELVDLRQRIPSSSVEWAIGLRFNMLVALGDRHPTCEPDLTLGSQLFLQAASSMYDLRCRAVIEAQRTAMNEALAAVFDEVDVIIAATSPDVAFDAEQAPLPQVAGVDVPPLNIAALTMPSNICGNPAISVPAGTVGGLPVGVQLLARHHEDALLLDLARVLELEQPWPLVAPGAPC